MLEICDVEVRDESRLQEWYDVWRGAQTHRPEELIPSWESARLPLATPRDDAQISLFGVQESGTLLGAALLNLPTKDNPTLAYADVMTHAEHRRHGVGTALVTELERRTRAAGRERVLTEVFVPAGHEAEVTSD